MLNTRQATHYARCVINLGLRIFGHILIHKSKPSEIRFYEPALCASVGVLCFGKQTLYCETQRHILLGCVLEHTVLSEAVFFTTSKNVFIFHTIHHWKCVLKRQILMFG